MKENEKQIEKSILEYLAYKGLVIKINQSGIPVIKKNRVIALRPFTHSTKGLADIFYLHRGQAFFFEVKISKERDYIFKHYEQLRIYFGSNLKKLHYGNQIRFLEEAYKQGGRGGFVSSIEDVADYLR